MILTMDVKGKITTKVFVSIDGTYDYKHLRYNIMLKYLSICSIFEIEYTAYLIISILNITKPRDVKIKVFVAKQYCANYFVAYKNVTNGFILGTFFNDSVGTVPLVHLITQQL